MPNPSPKTTRIKARKPKPAQLVLPEGETWIMDVRQKAADNMIRYDNCTQSIVAAFIEELGLEEGGVLRAASGFLGGMMCSLTCGVHSAGVIVMGMIMGRERLEEGLDGILPMVFPTQELIGRLNGRLGSSSCKALTGVDFTNLEQAMAYRTSDEHQKCIARVADGTEEIARLIKDKHLTGEIF